MRNFVLAIAMVFWAGAASAQHPVDPEVCKTYEDTVEEVSEIIRGSGHKGWSALMDEATTKEFYDVGIGLGIIPPTAIVNAPQRIALFAVKEPMEVFVRGYDSNGCLYPRFAPRLSVQALILITTNMTDQGPDFNPVKFSPIGDRYFRI